MKVAIDIDDTLNEMHLQMLKYGQKYDNEYLNGKHLKNPDGYDTIDMFSWSAVTDLRFWKRYVDEISSTVSAKPFAKEITHKLKEAGHEIYIITARNNLWYGNAYDKSKAWLDKNEIKYDKLIVGYLNKNIPLKNNNIDIFIDDKPANCIRATKLNIKIFIMDNVFNKEVSNEKIIRIYNLEEAYYKIMTGN